MPPWVRVLESVQTVLTALMLAFVFRAFFVEAFIIPTGSMANSLLGQHGTLRCPNCGWEFDYGPDTHRSSGHGVFVPPEEAFCPNCHTSTPLDPEHVAVKAGDRVLVHKWPFALGGLLGPRRWDVIVFRDPNNPSQNFIKRLVALPNETIEIIDGDVFIKPDGAGEFRVARKPAAAQHALWSTVFDQAYLPADPDRAARPPAWVTEKPDQADGRGWRGLETRVIRYDARDDVSRATIFEPVGSRFYLQDVYGYNHGSAGDYVGDVRIVAEVTVSRGGGALRWEILRDGRLFAVELDRDAIALRTRPPDGDEVTLATRRTDAFRDGRPRVIEFGHLDWRVYVKVDGRELLATTDEQYSPQLDELRTSRRIAPLGLRMVARNVSLVMRRLRIDRDVYYAYSGAKTLRASAGQPFHLGADEYFVLGDNSPNSADSREWHRVGPHLRKALEDGSYHLGTVRGDQIVGKAFFVYLPGLLPIDREGNWRIPDVGRMRFIR